MIGVLARLLTAGVMFVRGHFLISGKPLRGAITARIG